MKVSLDWLREHVDIDQPVEDVAHRLTMCGLNCEAIEVHGDDHVFELEVTSNRPDHLGHRGVARELACLLDQPLKPLKTDYSEVDKDSTGKGLSEITSIEVDDDDRCGRYTARVALDVDVSESPQWLRKRLESIGLRSINLVVDLTNYVLMDLGQPLHAFDLDRLDGEELIIRRARYGEDFAAMDGTHHTLDTEDLVIADASRAVALAGVMGGVETGVGSTTRRILLESAWFDPVPVRSTSRRLGLASDSSYRFERRVDIDAADIASRRFFHLLCQETDCKVLSGCWEAMRDGLLDPPAEVPIRLDRTELILGESVPAAELTRVLSALGFQHAGGDDARSLWVPPTWRADCTREIDLIEEVGRIHGLDRVPDRQMAVRVVPEDRDAGLVERVKALLEGTGHHESLTFSFGSEGDHRELEEWWCLGDPWVVRNPVRSNEGVLRRSLLPGLLSCVRGNRLHGVDSVRLFEVARVFHRREGVDRPVEKIHLAWVHSNADGSRPSEAYRQVRGIADAVLELLRLGTESRSASTWNPVSTSCGLAGGSCAALDFFSERLGLVGAAPLDGVTGETWCGELDLGTLIGHSEVKHRYREFSRHPGVRRDLNIVVEESVLWRDIASEVDAAEMANFEGLTFLDVYRGKQVTQGHKSVTFSVAFRAPDRSLTHEEVDEAIEGLMQRLAGRFQARLRT
ncbi:MAG: phenylalanine--tRNA ligase subunit beta [Planctomycetes bacterium]|jgi:phenylalanyl-tRNA synthetase beta chain|nr:phenylalanine--tRNA ligase subunit beta [Planctomycetota bacterium]MBT6452803.1 phenylalanine--tRNA ligase subunit beta [Planctomycetota bacterium]MBT6785294.1 phenylalanine--tRNA ligase subunit beta [Planctomycetota bacterium]MBT7102680.1 phenylalanine--tRNA ligase subunit beta [Planctomycetota bacterium]MBT7639057.1 phenylalanine--tRNA ligase subunit beta [Planctomycetota bacterium]